MRHPSLLPWCGTGDSLVRVAPLTYNLSSGAVKLPSSRVLQTHREHLHSRSSAGALSSSSGFEVAGVLAAMDQWWRVNADNLSDMCTMFPAYTCITTLSNDGYPPIPGCRESWRLPASRPRPHHRPRPHPAQDLHVILSGKPALAKARSSISSQAGDSVAFMLTSTEIPAPARRGLWDTVGVEEPESRTSRYMGAIEKSTELIRQLSASSGIRHFLFFLCGNRVTTMIQSNYRLFYEVFGNKKVPIALAITHLEQELGAMEVWWVRNTKTLERTTSVVTEPLNFLM